MDCDQLDLIALIEGREVPPDQAEHLASCPACRRELAQLRRIMALLGRYFELKKKECPEIDLLLSETPLTPEIHAHVETCPFCREIYDLVHDFSDEFVAPQTGQPLPPMLNEKLVELKKESLTGRLQKTLAALKGKGAEMGRKLRDAGEKLTAAGPLPGAAPAAPEDITAVDDDSGKKGEAEPPDDVSGQKTDDTDETPDKKR